MKKIVLLSLSVFAAFSLSAQQPRDWAQYGRYERQNAALAGDCSFSVNIFIFPANHSSSLC